MNTPAIRTSVPGDLAAQIRDDRQVTVLGAKAWFLLHPEAAKQRGGVLGQLHPSVVF
ncbi:hypothetical protein [Saccharopolyspora sp. ASAGF58]|uniref:hypothetical protein n=1 Tax=Saccharopolyspora sp. ASAGF58 TaxID=2719023 RepID=UPI001447A74B|nr:hypothetical protein [Saccharopolyspora sp. ASAGF58]